MSSSCSFRYRDNVLTEVEICVHQLGEHTGDIMLLATSTNLFVWLLPETWHAEPASIWEAANVGNLLCDDYNYSCNSP